MKNAFVLLFLLTLMACQPKKVYNNDEFEAGNKNNVTINPFGTYVVKDRIKTMDKAVLYLDSTSARVVFLDSAQNEITFKSNWKIIGFDTQSLNLPKPFEKVIFTEKGLYFMDSVENVYFKKTADSIVPISLIAPLTPKDSIEN